MLAGGCPKFGNDSDRAISASSLRRPLAAAIKPLSLRQVSHSVQTGEAKGVAVHSEGARRPKGAAEIRVSAAPFVHYEHGPSTMKQTKTLRGKAIANL